MARALSGRGVKLGSGEQGLGTTSRVIKDTPEAPLNAWLVHLEWWHESLALQTLRKLKRTALAWSPLVFVSERGLPFTMALGCDRSHVQCVAPRDVAGRAGLDIIHLYKLDIADHGQRTATIAWHKARVKVDDAAAAPGQAVGARANPTRQAGHLGHRAFTLHQMD
jgi:hypothetical protein